MTEPLCLAVSQILCSWIREEMESREKEKKDRSGVGGGGRIGDSEAEKSGNVV